MTEASTDPKDSVSTWFVRQALAGLARRGVAPEGVLRAAGIQARLLESEQSRVSAASFAELWLAIARALDDELFGLDSRRMKQGSFALLCRATAQAPALRPALQLAAQFLNVVMDDARVELHADGAVAGLRVIENPAAARAPAYRVFAHETLLMMLHGLMCWLIGRRIPLHAAAFAYPQPAWWAEYHAMYCSTLTFDQPVTQISFAARLLDAAVIQDEAGVREFLREAPHNFIVKYKDPKSCQARIRGRLRSTPPAQWPSFAELAAEFEVAASTLHRRLDQEGSSFRQIKDHLRRDLAIDRLTHSAGSIAEISAQLGFAEPSAFHRAFKLWTGLRPGDYRRRDQAVPPG